jgi:hypothetical protein
LLHLTLNPNCHGEWLKKNRVENAVQVMDDAWNELAMLVRAWRNQVLLEGYGDFGRKCKRSQNAKVREQCFWSVEGCFLGLQNGEKIVKW